jgi:hypothetical protein
LIFSTTSLNWTCFGSKVTAAFSEAKLTAVSVTPSKRFKPRSIFAAQLAQVIPVIGRETFCSGMIFFILLATEQTFPVTFRGRWGFSVCFFRHC